MARILDDFRRFLKDIIMNNSWSVCCILMLIYTPLYMSWRLAVTIQVIMVNV